MFQALLPHIENQSVLPGDEANDAGDGTPDQFPGPAVSRPGHPGAPPHVYPPPVVVHQAAVEVVGPRVGEVPTLLPNTCVERRAVETGGVLRLRDPADLESGVDDGGHGTVSILLKGGVSGTEQLCDPRFESSE